MLPTARFVTIALAAFLVAAPILAGTPPVSFSKSVQSLDRVERVVMPAMDNAALLLGVETPQSPFRGPFRFAESIPTVLDSGDAGTWERHNDGSWTWRIRIYSPNAVRLGVTFSQFDLPPSASLWSYDPGASAINGPYTGTMAGERWTPSVLGNELIVEIHVPDADRNLVHVTVGTVNHGFRGFPTKDNGTCNIDTICSQGNPWRSQIRSVARMEFGLSTCTGQLVNNTAGDGRALFLTANHCFAGNYDRPPNPAPAATLKVCFNYESQVCSARNGTPVDCLEGSTFLAAERDSDFMLLELNPPIPPSFDVHFAGWDRSGSTPQSATGIHHPGFREKALAIDNNPLSTDTEFFTDTHWRVGGWETGTTEGGSSGSCIYNPANGLCVGVLTGGFAGCPDALPTPPTRPEDYYGKLSGAWNGDGTPSTRLSDWLDPASTGATTLSGMDPAAGSNCTSSDTAACIVNGRFKVELTWRGVNTITADALVFQGFSSNQSALFHFGNAENLEILVKMIDACNTTFNSFWVFAAGTTNVEFTLTVTDTETGVIKTYSNPLGNPANAITDTSAFLTCPV